MLYYNQRETAGSPRLGGFTDVPVIISEYNISDDRFTVLAETTKRQLAAGAKHQKRVVERLYVPKRQLDMIKERLQMQEEMAI